MLAYFNLRGRLDRKAFLRVGFVLLLARLALELLMTFAFKLNSHVVSSVFVPMLSWRLSPNESWGGAYLPTLIAVSIPFVWIGFAVSARRAADAGLTPWYALFTFIPLVQVAILLHLSIVDSCSESDDDVNERLEHAQGEARNGLIGLLATSGLGAIYTVLSVFGLKEYGLALFVVAPFGLGVVASYLANMHEPRSLSRSTMSTFIALTVTGGFLLLTALEGVICLLMAVPLAYPLGFLGAIAGRAIAAKTTGRARHLRVSAAILLMPMVAVLESVAPADLKSREVATAIMVQAPPESVWRELVSHQTLSPPTEWEFRAGIAYPLTSRVIGTGVGARRLTEFDTGLADAFVTSWKEGEHLAFRVLRQPHPMTELSPWQHVHAPHLEGFVETESGEFRLIRAEGNATLLEGRTRYVVDIAPGDYWAFFSDKMVALIHHRYLAHIKAKAEGTVKSTDH